MDFKKDYINYALHTIIQNEFYGARDDVRIRKILEKIISIPDVAKATFLAGKTAGLEILFKYLLYISDKIDKSQITVFNLKDNFEYDLQNLKKICGEIKKYRSEIKKPVSKEPELEIAEKVSPDTSIDENSAAEESPVEESPVEESPIEENTVEESTEEETAEIEEVEGFTLIENKESDNSNDEVFGLAGITRSVEMEEESENISVSNETGDVAAEEADETGEAGKPEEADETVEAGEPEEADEPAAEIEEESIKKIEFAEQPFEEHIEAEDDEILTEADVKKINRMKEEEEKGEEEKKEEKEEEEKKVKEELEIEIKNSSTQGNEQGEDIKEGSVTSEVYYRFENKFFEEVKILEKLFSNTEKECKGKPLAKLREKSLQSFSEIIEISSELANLTRQLSLDLTADIFFTINLLFTKAINNPILITPERIKYLSSSLLLVTSLIKGEDYLGYDELVKKIEALREELTKPVETQKKEITGEKPAAENHNGRESEPAAQKKVEPRHEAVSPEAVSPEAVSPEAEKPKAVESEIQTPAEIPEKETKQVDYPKEILEKPTSKSGETESQKMDTVLFKMKYLVKEFEKNFTNLISSEDEFNKFEILDEIDNLNNLLRMLAKISSSVKNTEVLKLSEVSYVFLKYLKDYRMNLLDTEIQQIIKYIIFTYKMLITDRKPEDFDILVQYLNNPVKIFTDT